MLTNWRAIVGMLAVIVGCLWLTWFLYYLMSNPISTLTYYNPLFQLGFLFLIIWIFTSFTIKFVMLMGRRFRWINWLSISLFLIEAMIVCIARFQLFDIVHYNVVSISLCMLFFTGWLIIDVVDLFEPHGGAQ
jgi:hypothetical protein